MTQFDFAALLRAIAGAFVFPAMLLTSCLSAASMGCSATQQKDALAYAMETNGELDATAATDGEIGFFFGTKFGIKLPVTATAHAKNNPYAQRMTPVPVTVVPAPVVPAKPVTP